jgi:UDP-glucose 4-epimerase
VTIHIAITGANGFIGNQLCSYIEQHLNAKIIRITRNTLPCFAQSNDELIAQLQQVDCLIHLAARAHARSSNADFERDNIQLSERVAQICIAAKIPRLIYLSSIKANGNSTSARAPFSAEEAPSPEDDYGISKWQVEQMLNRETVATQTELIIIRPPLVYGDKNKGNLGSLVSVIKKGIPLPFAAIKNKRDLVSIENLCSLITTCITHPNACGQTLLVSDGITRTTTEIIQLLCEKEQLQCTLFKIPSVMFRILHRYKPIRAYIESLTGDLQVNIQKTKTLLNWQPKA